MIAKYGFVHVGMFCGISRASYVIQVFCFYISLVGDKKIILRCRIRKTAILQQQIAAYLKLLYSAISDLVRGKA